MDVAANIASNLATNMAPGISSAPNMSDGVNAILESEAQAVAGRWYEWWHSAKGVGLSTPTMARSWQGQRQNIVLVASTVVPPAYGVIGGVMGDAPLLSTVGNGSGTAASMISTVDARIAAAFPASCRPYIAAYFRSKSASATVTSVSLLSGGTARVSVRKTSVHRLSGLGGLASGNINSLSANDAYVNNEVMLQEQLYDGSNVIMLKNRVAADTDAGTGDLASAADNVRIGVSDGANDDYGLIVAASWVPSDAAKNAIQAYAVVEFS